MFSSSKAPKAFFTQEDRPTSHHLTDEYVLNSDHPIAVSHIEPKSIAARPPTDDEIWDRYCPNNY